MKNPANNPSGPQYIELNTSMGQRNNQKTSLKSGTSDNGINYRVPGKRANSKADKYDPIDPNNPMNLGMSGPMTAQMGGVVGVGGATR